MADEVLIVDYGSGNVRSIYNALRRGARAGQEVLLSADPGAIDGAERIVLPGVGAFAECRRKLERSGVWPSVMKAVGDGRPLLGICVGMQVMADEGREFETAKGLGLIPGTVRKMNTAGGGGLRKLPHVGWSSVRPNGGELFDSIRPGDFFYFVHSYVFDCTDDRDVAAVASYGETFTAAIRRGSIFGCQFHPEKSGPAGLRLMENFCRWKP